MGLKKLQKFYERRKNGVPEELKRVSDCFREFRALMKSFPGRYQVCFKGSQEDFRGFQVDHRGFRLILRGLKR